MSLSHSTSNRTTFRVVTDAHGEHWFVAKDIAESLEYRMASDLTRVLATDEVRTHDVRTDAGTREMSIISEPGLYRAIFAAKPHSHEKAEKVERFRRWVTHTVLPSIRKTGSYTTPGAPSPQPRPSPLQAQVLAHLEVARTLASFIPGLKPELAAACALDAIHRDTGLTMEPHRKGLPAAAEPPARLNATQLGQKVGLSARKMNLRLEACGLQRRNEREEWELTDAGREYAEAVPFSRNGHAAYQLLWRPEVLGVLEDVARSSAISVGLG
ncbi:Bro-N domain-containing protein [Myxococcus sp. AB036A]|uniref:BRO-N domain-containing protein n=1 Tax=Myxococcus sp. AB036A TaxID=2562793 RepID=UPI0011464622